MVNRSRIRMVRIGNGILTSRGWATNTREKWSVHFQSELKHNTVLFVSAKMDTYIASRDTACVVCPMTHYINRGELKMPKLVSNVVCRLYGVSEKPNKNGEYKLKPFDDDAFNKEFDESKIKDVLTDLTNALYKSEEGCRWFLMEFTDEKCDDEVFTIKIDCNKRLEIPNITDLFNRDSVDAGPGYFKYFILVNATRTEYRWVVVSSYTVYSG
jgi:hypothetical protein